MDVSMNGTMENMEIEKWILDGNDCLSEDVKDTDTLLSVASQNLDAACSWDIMGPILFKGKDGEYYVGTVDFVISKAAPEYVKATLDNM